MSNYISYDARPDLEGIQMNNGLTSVLVSVLSLAASKLATDDAQRTFAVWINLHDQGVFGTGIVGFDVSEMPWNPATLEAERAFVLQAIAAAHAKTGWERLHYTPKEDWVFPCLEQFRILIEAFALEHIQTSSARVWVYCEPPTTFSLCSVHQVYQHPFGCALCGDMA
jgi:hypothetical protein